MWSIIGHSAALTALQNAVASGRPASSWLFSGPDGVGKLATALEFAAALNCTSSEERPCGECRDCRDSLANRHPDVEVVGPGGICDEPDHGYHPESRDLRICQIRRVDRLLTLSPYSGRRRIAILDAADTLRVEAANAFLKTLEEPPGESVIILLAEREERLPETVLSRCQRLRFRPVERQAVVNVLIARGAAGEQAAEIAGAAAGRLGWALRALADPSLLQERSQMLDEAVRVAHAGRVGRFAWAREAADRSPGVRERFQRELKLWESWWRDVLLYAAGGGEGAANVDRSRALEEEGKLYGAGEIVAFLQALTRTNEYLQANVDPQLALENLVLELPRAALLRQEHGETSVTHR